MHVLDDEGGGASFERFGEQVSGLPRARAGGGT